MSSRPLSVDAAAATSCRNHKVWSRFSTAPNTVQQHIDSLINNKKLHKGRFKSSKQEFKCLRHDCFKCTTMHCTFYDATNIRIIERSGSCNCAENNADEHFQRGMPIRAIEIAEGMMRHNPNFTALEFQQGILMELMVDEHCALDKAVSW